jgi:predicted dehydrogenase
VINDEQLAEVVTAASEAKTGSVTVGFNRRFAPATLLVKEHFAKVHAAKQILIRVNAGSIPADHWIHNPKVGGGRLIGEGCHFVDLSVALAGSLIKTIHATAIEMPNVEHAIWDNFSLQMSHVDGSISTIVYTAIGDSGLAKERVEVSAGGRSAVLDDFQRVETWAHNKATRKSLGAQDKGQKAEIKAWIAAVKNGTASIPFTEIINVHRACLGAIQSLRDRAPVNIV